MSSPLRLVLVSLVLAIVVACSSDPPSTFLQASDLELAEGSPDFDPNNLVDTPSFVDWQALDAVQVQTFLAKSPYDRLSFLETYQSNGVRANDAIVRAARTYRINPIVLLVRLQMTQGLVGSRDYPFPTDRVEYVFRCGCTAPKKCDSAFAGLDRQLDCMARAMREALDAIGAQGQTSGGWAPENPSITLDGVKITPANEATAVLYQILPRVANRAAGGNWLFWNLYQIYSLAIGYAGATDGGTGDAWVGDGCQADAQCGFQDGQCLPAPDSPGGLCTAPCTGSCPTDPSKPATFCAQFAGQPEAGYCVAVCNPDAPGSCRPGYTCTRNVARFGNPKEAKSVCLPTR
ncbi:MAG: hypothetical protein JNL38_26135 [Myxococcales bacterium]|jgi:hypothetical protein|nr:hypothetical protein [Myxococcales bacterium]